MTTTTDTPPDPVKASPEELEGKRARVTYEAGESFQGMVCDVERTTRGQRIIHITWQDSVVRCVDPRRSAVDVSILDEGDVDGS